MADCGGEIEAAADAGPWPDRVNILGVGVSAANIPAALAQFDRWIAAGARHYVCVADVNSIMNGRWNPDFRRLLNAAGMVTSDGMPLVVLARLARGRHVSRVYGPDLLLAACEHGLASGRRHYFFGGADGVAQNLADRLATRFPGLQVAGVESPPFRPLTPQEEEQTVARINASGADFLWVGLGAPKQELWMREFRPRLTTPVMLGVGAAFDFHSGAKPQAPRWLRQAGFEWLFRLLTEPARLWPRYRRVVPGFLLGLAHQRLRPADFPLE